jgi:ankyrin repeat protein
MKHKKNAETDAALLVAAEGGDSGSVKRALSQGANVNCTTEREPCENVTPLMLASREGHADVVRVLLKAGADLERRTHCIVPGEPSRETALHWAIIGQHANTAKILLSAGSDVDANSTRGTPLSYAVEQEIFDIVKLLLAGGASPKRPSGVECRLPLSLAAERGNKHILRSLLRAGAKPQANKLSGKTPLMLACVNDHPEGAKLLIGAGDRVGATDKEGRTPLMYAAWGNSGECVQILLRMGAKSDVRESAGKTAFDLAREVDSDQALFYLEKLARR